MCITVKNTLSRSQNQAWRDKKRALSRGSTKGGIEISPFVFWFFLQKKNIILQIMIIYVIMF